MKTQEFLQNVHNVCDYMKKMNDETFNVIILVLYVDDMFILANVDECKSELKFTFKMSDIGESKRILNMDIHRDFENKIL